MAVFVAGFAVGSMTGAMALIIWALAAAEKNDEQDN